MKIVTKLKIFGTFATVLVIILGVMTYWSFSQVDLAIGKDRVTRELVKDVFVLNILSGDYIQTRGERARIQWMSQYQKLNHDINSYVVESEDEKDIIDKLQIGLKATLVHFSQLQENVSEGKLSGNQELERRLSGQLSLDVQAIVSLVSGLADINTKKLTSVRQATSVIMPTFFLLLGFLFISTYFLLARSISRSIKKLIDGTKELASGKLSFRYEIKNKDEFGQLSTAFNDMASSLQKLDETKTEFIYLVSHELRTPVGAIKGFMSMINNGDYGERNKKLQRPLYLITSAVDRVLHIVNEMLDVSKIQVDKVVLNFSEFKIREIIDKSISNLKPMASEKGIGLEFENSAPFTIRADKDKVFEIINNLIENALKFTKTGTIKVFLEKKDNMLRIFVSDTGIGIASKYQEKLFDKFDEIKLKQAGKTSGIGLGLYISREFARKMNGDLWIEESEVGKGSTFVLSLPLSASSNENQ